jgi:hypothetical protein
MKWQLTVVIEFDTSTDSGGSWARKLAVKTATKFFNHLPPNTALRHITLLRKRHNEDIWRP